jgi:vacuolar-type H+-ATPase subunit F/Vma7
VARIVYLGDALAAAGFRLAGVDARVPQAGTEADAVAAARDGAVLVLVSAAVASALPAAQLAAWRGALAPLFLVVPDMHSTQPPGDPLRHVLGQLGIS